MIVIRILAAVGAVLALVIVALSVIALLILWFYWSIGLEEPWSLLLSPVIVLGAAVVVFLCTILFKTWRGEDP
jgi:hypothetical protein